MTDWSFFFLWGRAVKLCSWERKTTRGYAARRACWWWTTASQGLWFESRKGTRRSWMCTTKAIMESPSTGTYLRWSRFLLQDHVLSFGGPSWHSHPKMVCAAVRQETEAGSKRTVSGPYLPKKPLSICEGALNKKIIRPCCFLLLIGVQLSRWKHYPFAEMLLPEKIPSRKSPLRLNIIIWQLNIEFYQRLNQNTRLPSWIRPFEDPG